MAPPTYTQTGRPLAISTPLGPDAVQLTAIQGHESLSRLYHFELELLTEHQRPIIFERLLGQRVTVTLELPHARRYFNGLVNRLSQGHASGRFLHYRAEIVPDFWLLTKKSQSRIFQHLTVPDILKQILQGLDASYQIQGGFHARDFCVQYRESDFAFASRLMEEEGIYYFFQHTAGGHRLILSNTPMGHPDVPEKSLVPFNATQGGVWDEDRVTSWQKVQELRSGKYTLWDHSFELPRMHLEAQRPILDSVPVGQVTHKLQVGNNRQLEVYDYPGGYAQRFDGIDRGGGERLAELQKIFEDNLRTAGIRMQEEAVPGLAIHGTSKCLQFAAGHKFTLMGHSDGDGLYVLTHVQHSARQAGFASSAHGEGFSYDNAFTCIPYALPFRPARRTPRPVIHGTQTAVVVGPPGEEIFVDKYGRVKVQFPWDRQGKNDADSSCWVRVAQAWAGKIYGAFFWPRVGHEVVVAFEEGDPDRPIIIGSVYNAENTTPYQLPEAKDHSGVATQSTPGGSIEEYNELTFIDEKGNELVYLRAQNDCEREVLNDDRLYVGNTQTVEIKNGRKTTIQHGHCEKCVEDGDAITRVGGKVILQHGGKATPSGGPGLSGITVPKASPSITLDKDSIWLRVGKNRIGINRRGISLKCGSSAILLRPGEITIKSPSIWCEASSWIGLSTSYLYLGAPLTQATGMIQCPLLLADAVAATAYSSGAGNIL
jgi:type VI secretion system secreted protein VgrG